MQDLGPDDLALSAETQDALDRFLAEAQEAFPEKLDHVVLFGSVARGEASASSDVDLFVEWDGPEGEAIRSLVPITTRIRLDTGVDIAVHPVSPERLETLRDATTSFYRNVQRDGVGLA
jgi:predicted nucleotidyltransferase